MKTLLLFVLAVSVAIIGGCSSGESYSRAGYDFGGLDKVAVVDVIGDIKGDAAKNQISDFFVMELLKRGYTPIERSQVKSLIKEQEFQKSGITSEQAAAKAGKILNVPAVILVNIPNFGEEVSMTVKMINVEDGSILWIGSGAGNTGRTLGTIAGAAGGAGAGAAVAGDNKTAGAIAGGVLGGVAGQALSPQKAEGAHKVVKKICKTMPAKMIKTR